MRTVAQADTRGLTTALIYTRVSSDEQAREGVSLDAQLAECRHYAARKGWVLGDEYQDVMAGTRDDRPRYRALLDEVRRRRANGKQAVVVVAALDRLGRRLLERIRCREELTGLGVTVHSVRDGGEVSDLVANILGSVAEEEVRRLGERVSAAKQHIIKAGWYPVGRCPWGYRLRPATIDERSNGSPTKVLEMDQNTAPFAREAFKRAAAGETVRRVVRWIGTLPSAARGDRSLTYSVVRRLLSNPLYAGRVPDSGAGFQQLAPSRWPPLVDDSTFDRVQERIGNHLRVPRQASGRYTLTGLVRCPKCGARMAGWSRKGRNGYYRCNGFLRGASSPDPRCTAVVPAPVLDRSALHAVSDLVDGLGSGDTALGLILEREWDRLRSQEAGGDWEERARALEQGSERARQRLTGAAELLVDGEIDRLGYELLRDKVHADLEALSAELERLRGVRATPSLPPLASVLAQAGSWSEVLRETDGTERREVLAVLIDHITPIRAGRGQYDAAIEWTSLGQALRSVLQHARKSADRVVQAA